MMRVAGELWLIRQALLIFFLARGNKDSGRQNVYMRTCGLDS
jgi:hypothetical protein